MLKLIALRFKETRGLFPLIALLLLCQLGAARVSSGALTSEAALPGLAFYSEAVESEAEKLILILSESPELRLVAADSVADGRRMVSGRTVSGFVVIHPGFGEMRRDSLTFYAAAGATEARLLSEHVLAAALALRGEKRLNAALADRGLPETDLKRITEPFLSVEYEGPAFAAEEVSTPPKQGVALLFLLLSSLYASALLRANSRIKALGRAASLRHYAAGAVVSVLVWFGVCLLYWLLSGLLYGVAADGHVLLAFCAVAVYSIGFGGLLARWGDWGFLPYLFLNMTLGGGLWESIRAPEFLKPFLPLWAGLSGCGGSIPDSLLLFAIGGILLLGGGVIHVLPKMRTKNAG
jgi:hypothetical protein